MFFRAARRLKNSDCMPESLPDSSFKRFSQQIKASSLDKDLLYPFSQLNTSKALHFLRQTDSMKQTFDSGKILLLDKLTETFYSETHRAYYIENNTFLAQKSIRLDSTASWNQINIVLRQYSNQPSSLFAKTLSIDYNENKQTVKIWNELQNTTLRDHFFDLEEDQKIIWLKERFRSNILQISQQLNALKQLGVEFEGKHVDPHKIFVENSSQTLKLYDLSDFTINDQMCERATLNKELVEIAKQTLLSLISSSGKDGKNIDISKVEADLENEAINALKEIESLTQKQPSIDSKEDLSDDSVKKSSPIVEKTLIQEDLSKTKKDISTKTRMSETESKPILTKADKKMNPQALKDDLRDVYIQQAEALKAQGDFKGSIEYYEKAREIEKSRAQEKAKEREEAMKPPGYDWETIGLMLKDLMTSEEQRYRNSLKNNRNKEATRSTASIIETYFVNILLILIFYYMFYVALKENGGHIDEDGKFVVEIKLGDTHQTTATTKN